MVHIIYHVSWYKHWRFLIYFSSLWNAVGKGGVNLMNKLNPLPDDKNFDWSKLKQIADDISKCI